MIYQKKKHLFLKVFYIGKPFKKVVLFFERSLFSEIKILKLISGPEFKKWDKQEFIRFDFCLRNKKKIIKKIVKFKVQIETIVHIIQIE